MSEIQKNTKITETKKKSELTAKTNFDLGKLLYPEPVFLPASFTEETEEIRFTYELRGMKPVSEIKKESREKQYQFLVNFYRLWDAYAHYRIRLSPENLYYDENYLPYVKQRDLYGKGEKADEEAYLFDYKAYVGGILGRRYEVEQLRQNGLEVLKKESFFQEYREAGSAGELQEILREQKKAYEEKERKTKKLVSRSGSRVRTVLAVGAPILLAACLGALIYEHQYVLPFCSQVIAANEAYISSDYVGCIDSMQGVDTERMDVSTKYILAVSYAKSESLKRDEIADIISRLSLYSNEKELEYWIALGRMDMSRAQDLAQSLSDDQLLVYAYMKELNQLESNTAMAGEEKQARISELKANIQSLGEKYTAE